MRFNVLDRALDPFQTSFLEASAGTGKTFAIEHLYVRLIIEGEDPLKVEEILVVTFTRAATRELKMRLRANLAEALFALESGNAEIDYLKKQQELGSKRAISRLKGALAYADQMQVFTIHGFCHKMLSEFAFEANVAAFLEDPDEEDYKGSMRRLVADFFRTGVNSAAYSPVQLHLLLKNFKHDFSKLSSHLMKLIEKGARIDPLPSFEELFKQFQESLFFAEKENFLSDFQALAACYKEMTDPVFASQAALLAEILEKQKCSPQEFDQLLKEKVFFLERMHAGNLKVRAKTPSCNYPGLLCRLRENLLPIIEEAKDLSSLSLRIARSCQERWEKRKEKNLPDELLKKMALALDKETFRGKASKKYAAAVIDEFQDTDPLQWEIFHRLFFGNTRAFYLVGDPKQSIYAFRNADLKTYESAKKCFGKERSFYLDTNYRSEPPLVHALNELFLAASRFLSSLELLQVKAGKKETTEWKDGKGHLHFFIAEDAKEDLFLPFIASEIQALKGHGSIAILVKDRYQATKTHLFLKKWKIPSLVVRSLNLSDSPAFTALLSLLQAVNSPWDYNQLKKALAGPLFNWTSAELLKGIENPALQEIKRLFYQWHHLYFERGFGAMIGSFFEKTPLDPSWAPAFREWVEILLLKEEDPLLFLQELDTSDEESYKQREEEGEGKVLIMTTHVSKGLEFDIVFALGLAARHTRKDEIVKIVDRLVKFKQEDAACKEIMAMQSEEKLRQFYVALTRAKKRIYVPLSRDLKEQSAPSELFCEHLGSDLYAALDLLKQRCSLTYSILNGMTFNLKVEETPVQHSIPSPILEANIPGRPLYLSSFSSLAQKKESRAVKVEEGALPPGAETGHLLHRIIEKRFASSEDLHTLIEREVELTALKGWEKQIFEMIDPLLDLPLDGFTLRDIEREEIFQEVEFLFPYQDGLVKGFIDLAFIHEGKYYFIDWKSNLLPGYTQPELEKAMQDADYFLQASIYAEALERYFGGFSLCCGGAFYIFLRGPAVYPLDPSGFSNAKTQRK